MSNAIKDSNGVNTIAGLLNTDGVTVTLPVAVPSSHVLNVDDNTTGAPTTVARAVREDNGVTTMVVVSNADGVSLVPLVVDSSGNLLVKST